MGTTEAVAEYLETLWAAGHSPATIASIRSCLSTFVTFTGSDDLGASTAVAIGFLSDRATKRRRNTLCAYFSTVKGFFAFAVRKGYIDCNPLDGLKAPKQEQIVTPPLTDDEILALYRVAPPYEQAMLLLLLGSGMRVGELAALRWEDFHGDQVVVRGKGAKERMLAPGQAAMAATRRLPRRGAFVFPMGCGAVQARLTALGKRARVRFHPHQMRHTYADRFLELGGTIEDLSESLGHSSLETTAVYLRAHRREKSLASQREHNPADRLFSSETKFSRAANSL